MLAGKHTDKICLAVLAVMILIVVLFMNGASLGILKVVDEDTDENAGNQYFTKNDLNQEWNIPGAVSVKLKGDTADIRGYGAYMKDGSLTIVDSGYYAVTGDLTDGSIIVDTHKNSKVWILLDGVNVNREDSAAMIIRNAEKVFLTLAEGTDNSFQSGTDYSEEAQQEFINAAIWSREDLTINGDGSLTVTTGYRHGIKSSDSLVVTGGRISITCPQDGMHASDSLNITGADIVIENCDDAIHSDRSIYIQDGSFNLTDCMEGLEAPLVEIAGGELTIFPIDDGINASIVDPETGNGQEQNSLVHITGGLIMIDNGHGVDADGIDSNGDIRIDGGTVLISMSGVSCNALDFGYEEGGKLYLNGGTVVAAGGRRMMELASDDSAQESITILKKYGFPHGTIMTVLDQDGTVLLEQRIEHSFTAVTYSSPELVRSGIYTIRMNEDYTQEITLDRTVFVTGDASFSSNGIAGRLSGMGIQPDEWVEKEEPTQENTSDGETTGSGIPEPDLSASGQEHLLELSAFGLETWLALGLSLLALMIGLATGVIMSKKTGR